MFLNFIFQPHWRYSERGAGPARWRNRFDNTPKKVLSGGSVRAKKVLSSGIIKMGVQKSIIKTDY